jgi:superfamily II DNA or RNA helicase
MTERRRFSNRERTALFLAADGRCQLCGVDLEPGWHVDHMTPWSRGGETDVINGQALCPTCNLKKGNRMTELRAWQADALAKFLRNSDDFLAVATPGAGKTTFALTAAQRTIELGTAQTLVVVVPTSHLRLQWATAAHRLGIKLDHRFANGAGALAKDFDGVVATYQAVASEPLLYRRLSKNALVILDEVHHGGDEQTWGTALRTAFEEAPRRLLLSGTPTRTDRAPVPFVQYDINGRFIAGHNYDYGEALQDRSVVRPIEFQALDGSVRWREAGAVIATELKDADDETLVNALRAALNPEGDWIGSVLRKADGELTRHRMEVPDAGGLVIAADQYKARKYAAILERITHEKPTLAISDEPGASESIRDFAGGRGRWIVAVQMVSEGVDIPRLAVGVYASNIRTELFFRQVVGRFVRVRSPEDETTSTLLVPSIEPLLRYAQKIEKTIDDALRAEERKLRETKDDLEQPRLFDLVEPLDSSVATHHSTILAGEAFTDEELHRAQSLIEMSGMPASVTPAQMARTLRMAGAGRVVTTITVPPVQHQVPLADEKVALRRLIKKKVGRLKSMTDGDYAHIHAALNQACGDKATVATVETLHRRLTLLDQWIEEA